MRWWLVVRGGWSCGVAGRAGWLVVPGWRDSNGLAIGPVLGMTVIMMVIMKPDWSYRPVWLHDHGPAEAIRKERRAGVEGQV
jgi:hypothetical protein